MIIILAGKWQFQVLPLEAVVSRTVRGFQTIRERRKEQSSINVIRKKVKLLLLIYLANSI